MEILEVLRRRYATKAYDATYRLSEQDIETIKEILTLAPSSINSQPWAFQIIGDGPLKEALAEQSWVNKDRINQASHLIVFYTYRDVATFLEERINLLGEHMQAYFNGFVAKQGEDGVKAWMTHQVYIALGVLLTGLGAMGLDSTPMEGIDAEAYDKILANNKYRPVLAVAVGRHSSEDRNHPSVRPKERRNDVIL